MTREEAHDTRRRQLSDAVVAEEKLLDGAPSVAKDGERIRRDSDAGATDETMMTASEILETEGLGPRLANLADDTDQHRT